MKKVIILLVVLFWGCASQRFEPPHVRTEDVSQVKGKVTHFRLTVGETVRGGNSSSDALGGAIVGGLLAGGAGATAGAVVGSSNTKATSVVVEPKACSFTFEFEGHKVSFETINKNFSLRCSLLREGDEIQVHRKYVYVDKVHRSAEFWLYVRSQGFDDEYFKASSVEW